MYRTKRRIRALTRPRRRTRGGAFGKDSPKSSKEHTRTIRLVTNNGEEFAVPENVAKMSNIIANMVGEDPDDDEAIPLPNVHSSIMSKVLEFCKHYQEEEPMKEIPRPLPDNNLATVVSPWYANFINSIDNDTLAELTKAANYLDIPSLLDLCCARVATYIKQRTPAEMRELFGIRLNLTAKQEDELRKQIAEN